MHILLINHYAGNPESGMEFRPFYLASEWIKNGHTVTIVAASYSHLRQKQPQVEQIFNIEMIDGIRYIWLRTPGYTGNDKNRIWNILAFIKGLYKYKVWMTERVDIVISSSTYTLDIFPARKIALSSGAKLIYEVHDLWPLSPMELGGYSKYHPFIFTIQCAENYAYKLSDQIVSMLPKARDHMIQHGLRSDKFNYIPNGINVEEWQKNEKYVLNDYPGPELQKYKSAGYFVVAYTGAIGIANALEVFIRAAALLKNYKIIFMIMGNGPEKENLITLSKGLDLNNIVFFNPVKKEFIPSLLKKFDILYLGLQNQPLFRFGISPNKLMDYMMTAKPIILASAAGNDMVSEAKCGITVEPENARAVAEAVMQLYKLSDNERKILGENGREYVMKNHDYKILANKFLAILAKE